MAGSYSIDSTKFTSIKGQPGRYRDLQTGDNISRARAIKETQGRAHSAIARENRQERIRAFGHHTEVARAALTREYGRGSDQFKDGMEELNELWRERPKPIRKGGTTEEWAYWNQRLENWADEYEISDDIDWDEFFGDSPSEE